MNDNADGAAIRNVVIAGGGTAGWMAAAALSYYFGSSLAITLVESDAIGTVGVGEATIPQIQLFNSALGIDEDTFVRATGGTFKLGIEFDGWSRPGERYFHGFGQVGSPIGLVPFYQYWLRYHAEGGQVPLEDFSANTLAARSGHFARNKGLPYAYQFDAGLFAQFLRKLATGRGVTRIEGEIRGVRQDGGTGNISSLNLADGQEITGDLFIDCTGFRGLLIEQVMKSGFDDWSDWLPCNRAWAAPTAVGDLLEPFTRSTAHDAGWQWHIPLQHRTGNGSVYASDFLPDELALAGFLARLRGEPEAEPRQLRFTTGKRRQAWKGNCVALGLASGFLEPLESTSIHMIQSGISRLVAQFPDRNFDPALAAEYNAQTDFEYESVRDFLILHYRLNQRAGDFWRYCREMPIPDTLRHRIELFENSARIVRYNTELFDVPSWLQVMWGQGLRPRGRHPMTDVVPAEDLAAYISLNAKTVAGLAASLSNHADFIAANCEATAGVD